MLFLERGFYDQGIDNVIEIDGDLDIILCDLM